MAQSKTHIPKHIAVIPDGNRRWAHARGLEPWEGHRAGTQNIESIIKKAYDLGVYCLSFWGSSLENLAKRPTSERRVLLKIYEQYFTRLIDSKEIDQKDVRINVMGQWEELFPKKLKTLLKDGVTRTQKHKKHVLNFFLAYSGTHEMISAVQKIAATQYSPDDIDAGTIKAHLLTHELPPVDYLVRTGGEPHLSAGFMMWDIADAQLYFVDTLFPDFDGDAFAQAVVVYEQRERRRGR